MNDKGFADPLHQPGGENTCWTTINAEENLVGVVDPLSGTFWLEPVNRGTLGAFADMGVVPERDVVHAADSDRRISSLICGRYSVNVDLVRRLADSMPGTSGDAMERDLFGNPREGIPSQRSLRRYPIVAVKAPGAALGVAGRINREMPVSQRWWQRSIAELKDADAATARAKLREGHDHMTAMMRPHTLGTMLIQGVLGRVRTLVESVGRPELELELSRGLGSLQEVNMLNRLWGVSRGHGDLDGFLAEYGFHCPGEGAVTSVAWREDPRALHATVDSYRAMDEDRAPLRSAAEVGRRRRAATAELMAALPPHRRPAAKMVLSLSDKLWALRETGKATYLHGIDVARAAVRIVGPSMAADGMIDTPDDVAFLTIDELKAGVSRDYRAEVEFRRARRDTYAAFDVPQTWEGTPTQIAKHADTTSTVRIEGLAASPGVVEGRVKVVTDPNAAELQEGEILVCKSTDPSYGTLFMLAAGAVIDVGAPSSHGAIVARELGIPCVINTRIGTRALKNGDVVRIDGGRGVVDVLESARRRSPTR
ncbi:PEP-utilizing enzyme [Mycobacterium sp.]|uniref:PEP-utilizing enzyme n=1 Tax=Mycobacterium sp. TaxID=1785 RepID=UPI0025D8084B|nr:PEP-utilizing enzyme [Mycobacterium sp.]